MLVLVTKVIIKIANKRNQTTLKPRYKLRNFELTFHKPLIYRTEKTIYVSYNKFKSDVFRNKLEPYFDKSFIIDV